MCSTMARANQETLPETLPALAHAEAAARLVTIVAAMTALDRQIERCTDPREESCLLTLRVEHEIGYLETLYGWAYEASDASVLQ
jgi:hypothetical protein